VIGARGWAWLLLVPALAAGAAEPAAEAYLYRYHNADGTLAISATLNQQAIYSGYQMLDDNGRVVKSVPAAPPEEQARRRARLEAQRQAEAQGRRDQELRRLYAGPGDAERARDRQIEALTLKLNYARNNLEQLEKKLADEVHDAARAERSGRAVSDNNREAIDRYSRQIDETRQRMAGFHTDIEAVRVQYQPIIERLRTLDASSGGTNAP